MILYAIEVAGQRAAQHLAVCLQYRRTGHHHVIQGTTGLCQDLGPEMFAYQALDSIAVDRAPKLFLRDRQAEPGARRGELGDPAQNREEPVGGSVRSGKDIRKLLRL